MSLDQQNLKRIREEIKNLVFGYIHRNQKNKRIPIDIIHICILFYGRTQDEWDPKCIASKMQLKDDTITKHTKSTRTGCNAYLKRIMDCGYHEWKFRLDIMNGQVWIGIWRIDEDNPDGMPPLEGCFQSTPKSRKPCGYAFTPLDGNLSDPEKGNYWKKYGKK